MRNIFSTEQLHVRDRFDYWHSITCKELVEHVGWPDNRLGFSAQIDVAEIADIGIFRFAHSPIGFSHNREHIALAKTDDLFLFRQLEGQLALEQADREVELAPGDMVLIDPMLPYQGRCPLDAEVLVLRIARRELEARLGQVHELVARSISPRPGVSGLTSAFLSELPTQATQLATNAELAVRNQTLDLIALTLCDDLNSLRPIGSPKTFILSRIRSAIEAGLTDPGLTSKIVAKSAGISVRYANLVLAQQGTSLSRLILSARLQRCRKALADPAQAHRRLSEIAYGWGFSDMTHFGRAFKKAFGVLPSEYRRISI